MELRRFAHKAIIIDYRVLLLPLTLATDRWTRAVFSEVFSFLNSFFTPVFNTWIIRVRPTVTQTLSDTALNKLQASVKRTDNMLL